LKPRNREVLDLLRSLHHVTPMDATRAIGISGGGLTKAISDLRIRHGYEISKVTKTDPLTGTRYPSYCLKFTPTPSPLMERLVAPVHHA
jgi:hypothetical protein